MPAKSLSETRWVGWLAGPAHVRYWVVTTSLLVAVVMVLFAIASISNRLFETPEFKRVLDVGGESNIPTFVNALLLAAAAVLAVLAASFVARRRGERLAMVAIAAAIALLAVDEAVGLRDRFGDRAYDAIRDLGDGRPGYVWIAPGLLVLGALWLTARQLRQPLRARLVFAAVLFLLGALVVETFNGWAFDFHHEKSFFVGTMIEESLEMAAAIVAGAALLQLVDVERSAGQVTIRRSTIGPETAASPR